MAEPDQIEPSIEELEIPMCPFNPERACPHKLYKYENPAWCQACIMLEIVKALELIRATQS